VPLLTCGFGVDVHDPLVVVTPDGNVKVPLLR
jgi:hypothetical protein